MPYVREGGVKYSSHKVGSPLDNIANTCLNCHKGTEKEFRETVERKLARKNELAAMAMDILAKAHLEAAKAWESRCHRGGDEGGAAGYSPRSMALGLCGCRSWRLFPCT
jgi:formate-dependent nitrite reductase cytochrome c552 subunit